MTEKASFLKRVIEREAEVKEMTIEAYDIKKVIEVSVNIIETASPLGWVVGGIIN